MKRNYKQIILLTLGLSVLNTSCNKYLEEEPDMRTQINTVEKLSQLLVTAYPDRNYYTFAETASDNAEDKSAALAGHNNEPFISLYNWNVVQETGNGSPTEYWNACYRAVAVTNEALAAIEKENFGAAADQYKGEALVARAYSIFMLSIFFSNPYHIGGDNSGLGIPYPLKPETTTRPVYERGTVESTYAQIEKDLEQGLSLLKGAKYEVPHYHFTQQAAFAFATRFYLFKGNWDKAIQYASAVYPDGNFKGNIRQYVTDLNPRSYAEYRQEYTKASKSWNLLLANTYSVFQRGSGAGNARYSFGETVKNIYTGNTVYGTKLINKFGVYTAPNYTTNKFNELFYYTNFQAGTGYPYIMAPLLTADEVLLNRAEAYVQKGSYDLALKDLNDFGTANIDAYNPTAHTLTIPKIKDYFQTNAGISNLSDKDAVIMAILEIKRIAFMQEGIRWMDILRHGLTVKHNFIEASGNETFQTLDKNDPRRVFQIPQDAINTGIPANPR